MIVGGLFVALSFLVIGPSPFFSIFGLRKPSIATISISMAVLGLGLSAALVPCFNDLNQSAVLVDVI